MPETTHKPSLDKIPEALRNLKWFPPSERRYWTDGETLLAAIPVCRNPNDPDGEWLYEFDVVRTCCDEHYFSIETMAGDLWGWELDDADFVVRVRT